MIHLCQCSPAFGPLFSTGAHPAMIHSIFLMLIPPPHTHTPEFKHKYNTYNSCFQKVYSSQLTRSHISTELIIFPSPSSHSQAFRSFNVRPNQPQNDYSLTTLLDSTLCVDYFYRGGYTIINYIPCFVVKERTKRIGGAVKAPGRRSSTLTPCCVCRIAF